MKRSWLLLAVLVAALLALMGLRKNSGEDNEFSQTKQITRLRNVAHQLLLSGHDSSTTIPPIDEQRGGRYLIHFSRAFSFSTDSLVNIVRSNFPDHHDYSVSVKEKNKDAILYSFVISTDTTETIIPCLKRQLPSDTYEIIVQLQGEQGTQVYWMALLALPVFGGTWFLTRRKKSSTSNNTNEAPDGISVAIGRYRFYPENQALELDGKPVELTGKEAQLLSIFSQSINQVIDRNRLQKIWEDEGVIVTRSLDMFVSKLRKKLSADDAVKIVSVHGKGYKLEVG